MRKIHLLLAFLGCSSLLFAEPDWELIARDLHKPNFREILVPVEKGASNLNYIIEIGKQKYFLKEKIVYTKDLYSDLGIEYEVLSKILPLNISPKPLYYNKDKSLLVLDYIDSNDREVSFQDKETRLAVFSMLKKIEKARVTIARQFRPFTLTSKLIETWKERGVYFSDDFFETLLPALQNMNEMVSEDPRVSLCHLDLHSLNVLQKDSQYWIIDWEYAMMGHPYLTLASMASVERWDDEMMKMLLVEYNGSFSQQEYAKLIRYRIAIDAFWAVWNTIQHYKSPLKMPYGDWATLYKEAALSRLREFDL
jgi:thiamine kinase-like enzyme